MRNYFKSLKINKGFTLIELLVVIGILGILAAALIATIDPFEQLRKAQDSNVKNTAVEFVNASTRYYTTHNTLPWSDSNITTISQCSGVTPANSIASINLTTASGTCYLQALITDNELKQGFTTVTSVLSNIVVAGTTNGATGCFQPQSRSQQRDANTKFIFSGGTFVTSNTCAALGGNVTTCFWCSQ